MGGRRLTYCRLVHESRMIEIRISGISLKIDMLLNKLTPEPTLLFVRDFQENVFIQVINSEMVLRTISIFFDTFIKTFSWKHLTRNKVKGHIY